MQLPDDDDFDEDYNTPPPAGCRKCGAPKDKRVVVSGFGKARYACSDCGTRWNDQGAQQ